MTNFERIANMSADEMAEAAVKEMRIFIMADPFFMSQLDFTVHPSREAAVAHNKEWLARVAKE